MEQVLLVGTAVVIGFGIFTWNGLTRLRMLAYNAWSDIDVQLKRRHDLVPNLVSLVRGQADYERGTLESVVEARNRAVAAEGPRASGEAEGTLATQVKGLLVLAEAYPDLRAQEGFLELQRGLTDIEDDVQDARRYYNAVVRDLNTRIGQFPANLIAGVMGFRPLEFFGLADRDEAAVPQVNMESPR